MIIGKNEYNGSNEFRRDAMHGVSTSPIPSRKMDPQFEWQSRFHDHIIRNDESFDKIQNYILNNPSNWRTDKFYIE